MKRICKLITSFAVLAVSLPAQRVVFTDNFTSYEVANWNINDDTGIRQTGEVGKLDLLEHASTSSTSSSDDSDDSVGRSDFRTQINNNSAGLLLSFDGYNDIYASYNYDWAQLISNEGDIINFSFTLGQFDPTIIGEEGDEITAAFPAAVFRFGGTSASSQDGGIDNDFALRLDYNSTEWSFFKNGEIESDGNTANDIEAGDKISVSIVNSSSSASVTIEIDEETVVDNQSITKVVANYVTFSQTHRAPGDHSAAINRFKDFAVTVTPVPEASTYAFIVGLIALGLCSVRKFRR